MYRLIVYLDYPQPIPQLGDSLKIVSIEDHDDYKQSRPYIIATLEPTNENKENK